MAFNTNLSGLPENSRWSCSCSQVFEENHGIAERGTLHEVDVRHRLTNDGLAYVLVLSNVALLAVALGFDVKVSQLLWQTFALSVSLAAVWAFGKGALKTLLGSIQGGNGGGEP